MKDFDFPIAFDDLIMFQLSILSIKKRKLGETSLKNA